MSVQHRWLVVAQHRSRMVALAQRLGAGDDAEDIAHEALLRAAQYEDLDEDRSAAFLAVITTRLTIDLHRRSARHRRAVGHAVLAPAVETFEQEVVDRDEAVMAANLLNARVPMQIRRVVVRRANGASWQELAVEQYESVRALETRVRRALLGLRQEVVSWRNEG